jgi:hypothetical protein
LENEQTKALIVEMDTDTGNPASVTTKRGGHNQGSYGVKELIYAYAMWISPAFHLKVIRSYGSKVTFGLSPKR